MKLLKRVIVSCWVLAAVLWGINTLIDWKAQESSRVEDRVRKLLEIQREELNIMVTGYSLDADLDLIGSPFLYRFYENGEKIRWSDNKKLPAYSQIRQPDSLYYLEHMSGKYLVQRRSIEKEDVVTDIFSVLILQKDFQIRNKFLQTLVNDKVFRNKPENISADKGTPITYKGTELFRIVPSGKAGSGLPLMVAGLVLLSIPFLIRLFLLWLRLRLSRVLYIVVSVLAVIVVPGLMLWFSIPADWFGIGLFDPVIYVSTIMDFTLGEILIAYTFLVTAASILTNNISNKSLGKIPSTVRIFFMTLATLFIYANMAAFYLIISDIMKHSQIVFDITDTISFSWERTVAFIIILLASVFYFMLNHVLARWISQLQIGGGLYLIMHLGCLTFFIYQFPGLFPLFLLQFAWYWVMYLSDISLRFRPVRKVALEYVLSIGAMLALVYAFIVYENFKEEELQAKEKFADKLVLEKDVLGEYFLNKIITQFKGDEVIKDRLGGGLFAWQNIREKVRREFVSSYFDKYEMTVYLFGADGEQLEDEGASYNTFKKKYAQPYFSTDYPGVYFVDDSDNISRREYACFIDYGNKGKMVITLNKKKNIPTSVFPELLVESKYEEQQENTYDYTIYRDGEVLYGQGAFGHTNYLTEDDLYKKELFEKGFIKEGKHFLGRKTQDGRIIVIVSDAYPNRSWVINFSFLFLLYILIISVIGLIYRLILNYRTLTLANKIQLYLAFGFLIPLFITGFTLLNTLNKSYREEITRNYLKRSIRISENLVEETRKFANNKTGLNTFANYVGDVSGFVQADLNVYDAQGQLITTSQPGIFGLNLLSDQINPVALRALNNDNQSLILTESIGLLDFKTTYTAITGYSDGKIYGILSLPFFDSKAHLEIQQKEVFADLLMIFAMIFLFALISGNYILNYLIGPLKVVSDHIRRTTLENDNQPIDYSSDDEIGLLVKEYNQMLIKLERNKAALARSQKESAWKEIARQVAHEIKNPLTPMRLKIQQLQRDLDDERQVKTLHSLLTQIDTLSDIADSFSEFAKMPAPENTDFNLVEVVTETCRLHSESNVQINLDTPDKKVMVWADPALMQRILNNLIINAIQAVPDDRQVKIDVSLKKEDQKVLLSCADNGTGIPEEIHEKIFTTYFSTKSTGTGIGLAVAKKGIENAGGNIWFETEQDEGTTFYITLPVYERL